MGAGPLYRLPHAKCVNFFIAFAPDLFPSTLLLFILKPSAFTFILYPIHTYHLALDQFPLKLPTKHLTYIYMPSIAAFYIPIVAYILTIMHIPFMQAAVHLNEIHCSTSYAQPSLIRACSSLLYSLSTLINTFPLLLVSPIPPCFFFFFLNPSFQSL